jgi:hypothetical protein
VKPPRTIATYAIEFLVMSALVLVYFRVNGFGVAHMTTPPGLVDRPIVVKTWTQEQWLRKDFPDIDSYASESQMSALLDPKMSQKAKYQIYADVWRRKHGEPVSASKPDMFRRTP